MKRIIAMSGLMLLGTFSLAFAANLPPCPTGTQADTTISNISAAGNSKNVVEAKAVAAAMTLFQQTYGTTSRCTSPQVQSATADNLGNGSAIVGACCVVPKFIP